jgi:ribosome-associated protein
MLEVNDRIRIPLRELDFSFARSSGPGGQNVNKVSSKAVLRWSIERSPSLPDDVRERFRARYPRRITADGDVVIQSQRFRDQGRNVADCLAKLRGLLLEVAVPPKRRRKTRPSRASIERRLSGKREVKQRKQRRARVSSDD